MLTLLDWMEVSVLTSPLKSIQVKCLLHQTMPQLFQL